MLSREDFLKANIPLKRETVVVQELEGALMVSEMSAEIRDRFEHKLLEKDKEGKISNGRAKLIAYTVIDEDGNRKFTDDDIETISKFPAAVLDPIVLAAQRLNGMRAQDVVEAEKN